MAERQTYKFTQPIQAVPVQGNQDVWNQVSKTIGTFYDQYVTGESDILAAKGKSEGIQAATGAEKDKITMLNAGTVYGQAFNDAAIKAYGSAIEIEAKNSVNEIAVNNSENRDDFNAVVETYRTEYISGITDPTFKAIADNKILEVAGVHERDIYAKWKEKQHLQNLVTTGANFDNTVEHTAVAGKEAIDKWHKAYADAAFADPLAPDYNPEVTLEHYTKTFAEDFKKQFYKIDAQLTDMLAIPGEHFNEGVINKKKSDAIEDIYTGVFLAEYENAASKDEGLAFKEKFIKDPIAYIKSQPHLVALFSDDILESYGMTTVGDDNMKDAIYTAMDVAWNRKQEVIEYEEKIAEEELEDEQSQNMIDALTSLVQKDGTISIDSLAKNKSKYSNQDYETLIGVVASNKYDYDDEPSVQELKMYLMTTEDDQKTQIAEVKKYIQAGRVSYTTATPLLKSALEDTMIDVTQSNDYQLALSLLKPHFQKKVGAYGAFAEGEHLIWMTQAIAELQDRTKSEGVNPRDIVDDIVNKYLGLREEQAPISRRTIVKKFRVGTGKEVKLDCESAGNYARARYNAHKNAKTFAKDVAAINNYGCNIQSNNQK